LWKIDDIDVCLVKMGAYAIYDINMGMDGMVHLVFREISGRCKCPNGMIREQQDEQIRFKRREKGTSPMPFASSQHRSSSWVISILA